MSPPCARADVAAVPAELDAGGAGAALEAGRTATLATGGGGGVGPAFAAGKAEKRHGEN